MNYQNLITEDEKLAYFNNLYNKAYLKRKNNFPSLLKQYYGTRETEGVNAVNARFCRNVTFELIESEVSSSIPVPKVKPKTASRKSENNAVKITELIKSVRDEQPFEKFNDLDERNTYVFGTSVYFLEWDKDKNSVKISVISADDFIPEPNVADIEDMEYVFLRYYLTASAVYERYGKIVDSLGEDTIEVVTCFFKADDKISEATFTRDALLSYNLDYYRKRRWELITGEEKSKKEQLVEEESLAVDQEVGDGIIPKLSPVTVNGKPTFQKVYDAETNSYLLVPKTKNTALPIYVPDKFPIVIRKNVSSIDSFYGVSDAEIIWPEQQEINKLETRIMEKLLKAGAIPYSAETTDVRLTDEIYTKGIRLKNLQEKNLLGVLDLEVSIAQDLTESDRLYQQAKRILGISDSFQGLPDSTANSGKAKELLINRSGARLTSKRVLKNAAYAELDEFIFKFYLAFFEGRKPLIVTDSEGELNPDGFSKYDFLEMTENGEYRYNDDYLFSADLSTDLSDNPYELWNEIKSNFTLGAFGSPETLAAKIIYWRNMERARYPLAKDNLELIIKEFGGEDVH